MLSTVLRRMDIAHVVWDDDESKVDQRGPPELEPVRVAVEATAICNLDLTLRNKYQLSEDGVSARDVVPGSNFVGVVLRCCEQAEERYEIQPGDRVASIIRYGGNTKLISVPADHLIRVPRSLDAADVACLISYYLPAFEMLNFGRSRPFHYSNTSLSGKKVFIASGGATLEAQALIQLVRVQGSREIFVTAPQKHHELLRKLGVTTLNESGDEWLSFIANTMDLVLDMNFPNQFSTIRNVVKPDGYLLCSPRPKGTTPGFWSCTPSVPVELGYFFELAQLSMMDRALLFDYAGYVDENRKEIFADMDFLLGLLSTRKLRPSVNRFITLKDIPHVHRELEKSKPTAGAIICEPWKE